MSFGVLIASDGQLLSDELMGWLVEVRVEQLLDEPTMFALRFAEDICDGAPFIMRRPELKRGRLLTIAVETPAGLRCLVHGPVEKITPTFTVGGPGSSVDIRGRDRRVQMTRSCARRAWEGLASTAIAEILTRYGFEPKVAETKHSYTEKDGTLNQRSTDLEFVTRLARQNGLSFWITYELTLQGRSLRVKTETANVKVSPERPSNDAGGVEDLAKMALAKARQLELRVSTADPCGNTVTSLEIEEDVERPNSFEGIALNERDGAEDRVQAEDPEPPIERGGRKLREVDGVERSLCMTAPGDGEDVRQRAEASLKEASWFVSAKASTTAHMLGGVLSPHDIVKVLGIGDRYYGDIQVKAVTHVITATDHYMDVELRSNAVNPTEGGER